MDNVEAPDRVVVYREALGRLLMSRRKRAELTLGKLATAAGMSRAAVGRIEAGDSSPNIEQIRRLAVALATTPAALLADLETGIDYLERRRTLVVEATSDDLSTRGRLVPSPELHGNSRVPLMQVAGVTLMREIEAALGLRPDPPRTAEEAFLAECHFLGIAPPRTAVERERAQNLIAIAILEGRFDGDGVVMFGPPDPELEDSVLLEVD